jgi:hypothetical protein
MDRKAFALALIGAASALGACASSSDDAHATPTSEQDLSTASIGNGGGCVTTSQGRSGELRGKYAHVKLTKDQFGEHAQVEIYDSKTGLLVNQPGEYSYEKVSGGEIEIYYINSGDRFAKFRIRSSSGGGAEIVDLYDTGGAPIPAKCALQAGGPGLALPVAQAPAAAKSIGSDFPLPPRNMATCTSTALVSGKVVQIHFERAKLYDDFLTAYANVYDPATHLFTENLLDGTNASFKDRSTSFALIGAPETDNANKEFGEISAKGSGANRHLAFKSGYGKLKAMGEIPLSCDFED